MGKALEKSVEHWKSIIRKIRKHDMIGNDEFRGGRCPLCRAYYEEEKKQEYYNCWACPLAYHRWKEEDCIDSEAFEGACAEEWQKFADTLGSYVEQHHGKLYRKIPIKEITLNAAKEMLKVLENLNEDERFTDYEYFEYTVSLL